MQYAELISSILSILKVRNRPIADVALSDSSMHYNLPALLNLKR